MSMLEVCITYQLGQFQLLQLKFSVKSKTTNKMIEAVTLTD